MKMNLSEQSILTLMLAYESELWGRASLNLHGQPFLNSELQWLNRYFYSEDGRSFSEGKCTQTFAEVDREQWAAFAQILYASPVIVKGEWARVMARIKSFCKWLKKRFPEDGLTIDVILTAVKEGGKEVERLFKCHRMLQNSLHPTPTLQDLAPVDEQDALLHIASQSQMDGLFEPIEDIFAVLSRDLKQQCVYLRGEAGGQHAVLALPPTLLRSLRTGDRLHLTLGIPNEGKARLIEAGHLRLPDGHLP